MKFLVYMTVLHDGAAVLGGAHLHANHLLRGVRVHTITIPRKAQPPQRVCLLVACKPIPVTRHLTEANVSIGTCFYPWLGWYCS